MPYLPAKDEVVSLNRLFSRGLWKWIIQRFQTGDYMAWGSISLFACFLEKKKIFGNWLWFSKMFHQRVFSDRIWRFSKFPFWRQILDIYRQPLLIFVRKLKKRKKSWAVGHLEKCLSLDKIAILKSLVVSQIVYLLLSSLPNPQGVIEEVNSLLYDFLWQQKWQN